MVLGGQFTAQLDAIRHRRQCIEIGADTFRRKYGLTLPKRGKVAFTEPEGELGDGAVFEESSLGRLLARSDATSEEGTTTFCGA